MTTIAEAAAFLAQRWPVFACDQFKRPVTPHGLHDATRDIATVREQFRRANAAMIGVPTGAASGIIVIDLDIKEEGADGLEWLAANAQRIPRTRSHRTMSGGLHLLFEAPPFRVRNSVGKIAPGVDVRGDGGYVIVPPSPGYTITDDTMPAPLPDWLVEALRPPPSPPQLPPPTPSQRHDGRGTPYALAALAAECDAIRRAPFGAQEHTLNSAGLKIGALVAGGEIDQADARAALIAAGLSMPSQPGREPWTYDTVVAKVDRAMRDGAAQPRTAPPRPGTSSGQMPASRAPPQAGDQQPAEAQTERAPLWIDDAEWEPANIPPRPWIAPHYLMRGTVSMLAGHGSVGKSSLVVAWTISLATGKPIGRFQPAAPSTVVTYNVEDDLDEQRRRYSAALIAQRRTPAEIGSRIIRCGPTGIGTLFERDPFSGRITCTNAMVALEQTIVDHRADVLVCDPLAELHNAEENDNTAMRAIVAAFRNLAARLNIAVLLLHHERKGAGTPGDVDRVRGASALIGAVRVAMTLTTMTPEEAERFSISPDDRRRHFRLDSGKANYAPPQDVEWWRLDGHQIGNGETVAACMPWSPPSTFDGLSMADCVAILDTLADGVNGCPFGSQGRARAEMFEVLEETHGVPPERAKDLLRAWIAAGTVTERPDCRSPNSRHTRSGYVVNREILSKMRQQNRAGAE